MKQRKVYRLGDDLFFLSAAVDAGDAVSMNRPIKKIMYNTDINIALLNSIMEETCRLHETIAQVRYRIIGDMQKRKIDTTFIL